MSSPFGYLVVPSIVSGGVVKRYTATNFGLSNAGGCWPRVNSRLGVAFF